MRLVGGNSVPKLGFPLMDVINWCEIEVFFMPAEEGFPGADIAIWRGDSLYINVNSILQ
jgi:hypothetical protein